MNNDGTISRRGSERGALIPIGASMRVRLTLQPATQQNQFRSRSTVRNLSSRSVSKDVHSARRTESYNRPASKFQLRESLVGAF
jgi:hypothetical protein